MNIAAINGSPKRDNSASGCLLDVLKAELRQPITEYHIRNRQFQLPRGLQEQEVLILAMPLYVDGVPSHLLNYLAEMEQMLKGRDIIVYGIVNCGFFEAVQNQWAIAVLQNWCEKAGLKWGQGIGIGGGGMITMLKGVPQDKGPMKNITAAIRELADNISKKQTGETRYVSPNFPRWLYKAAAEMGWRKQIKANGLKARDLSLKL